MQLMVLDAETTKALTSFLRLRDKQADSLFFIIRCWRFTAFT